MSRLDVGCTDLVHIRSLSRSLLIRPFSLSRHFLFISPLSTPNRTRSLTCQTEYFQSSLFGQSDTGHQFCNPIWSGQGAVWSKPDATRPVLAPSMWIKDLWRARERKIIGKNTAFLFHFLRLYFFLFSP